MKTIYVLTTGGTIEKVYSEQTGTVANTGSKIDRYLHLLRLPDAKINIVPLMNKDSLEMTDDDRLLLLGMVRAILKENAPIVITHGTDTLVQSGLYLERALTSLQIPIVMTGAMTPLGFEWSDGLQNFLNHFFRLGPVPKNLKRQAQGRPEETQEKLIKTVFAPVRDVVKQRFVGQKSDMRMPGHLEADYKDTSCAQQVSNGHIIFLGR
jgi:L-asparaginase